MMFSRRSIFRAASGLAAFVGIRPSLAGNQENPVRFIHADSFAELHEVLKGLPNKQLDGPPRRVFNGKEGEYVEVHRRALARPGDEVVLERVVANEIANSISLLFNHGTNGTIIWRNRLETYIHPCAILNMYPDAKDRTWWTVIEKETVSSLDLDHLPGDRNWISIGAYGRLLVV